MKKNNWHKFGAQLLVLLRPPKWFSFVVCPLVFVVMGVQLALGGGSEGAAIAVYVLSAYCLAVWVVNFPAFARSAKAAAKRTEERSAVINAIKSTRYGGKYFASIEFRAKISVYTGLAADILYTLFRAVAGISGGSVWLISMSVYYLVLAALRGNIAVCIRGGADDRKRQWRCYRRTGVLLLLLNIPMGGMIVLMVTTDSGYQYAGYIIYLSAIYTFYMVTRAVMNLFKFRRIGSPALSAAKVVDFTSALMSLLGLQTAMISRFSEKADDFRTMMNAITGGFVFLGVTALAVYMLVRSAAVRKNCAGENEGECA